MDLETHVLAAVDKDGCIADSGEFAKSIGVEDHNVIVGIIKSLEAYEMIVTEVRQSMIPTQVMTQRQGPTSMEIERFPLFHLCRMSHILGTY